VKGLEGRAYNIIIERLRDHGIKDIVTGDAYYSMYDLRYVLGTACKIPKKHQTVIVNELVSSGMLEKIDRENFCLKNNSKGK